MIDYLMAYFGMGILFWLCAFVIAVTSKHVNAPITIRTPRQLAIVLLLTYLLWPLFSMWVLLIEIIVPLVTALIKNEEIK